jgi:hypothetical protein
MLYRELLFMQFTIIDHKLSLFSNFIDNMSSFEFPTIDEIEFYDRFMIVHK